MTIHSYIEVLIEQISISLSSHTSIMDIQSISVGLSPFDDTFALFSDIPNKLPESKVFDQHQVSILDLSLDITIIYLGKIWETNLLVIWDINRLQLHGKLQAGNRLKMVFIMCIIHIGNIPNSKYQFYGYNSSINRFPAINNMAYLKMCWSIYCLVFSRC